MPRLLNEGVSSRGIGREIPSPRAFLFQVRRELGSHLLDRLAARRRDVLHAPFVEATALFAEAVGGADQDPSEGPREDPDDAPREDVADGLGG